jgi:thiol-disulfide isomerase/thioredoxin
MPSLHPLAILAVAAVAGGLAFAVSPPAGGDLKPQDVRPAPEFIGVTAWFNSAPLTMQGLRGKVVLVDFWTRECGNCLNQLPHVEEWSARYQDRGLVVVGVHSPEFDEEKSTPELRAAIERLRIAHPVAQDNALATWNAFGNRYWPAVYLVDRRGRVVYMHYGEGRYEETERRIRDLLAEPAG